MLEVQQHSQRLPISLPQRVPAVRRQNLQPRRQNVWLLADEFRPYPGSSGIVSGTRWARIGRPGHLRPLQVRQDFFHHQRCRSWCAGLLTNEWLHMTPCRVLTAAQEPSGGHDLALATRWLQCLGKKVGYFEVAMSR